MRKTLKNRRKKPRLPATHSKPEPAVPSPPKVVSRKPTLARVSGLAARPADFPVGSVQSRAAARAMSMSKVDQEPIRAVLSQYQRDPETPLVMMPQMPDLPVHSSMPADRTPEIKPSAAIPDRQGPDRSAELEQARENYRRALKDMMRAIEPVPEPQWNYR